MELYFDLSQTAFDCLPNMIWTFFLSDLDLLIQYRREVCKILEAASDYALKAESNGPASYDTVATSSA
jgi:hypothetical protein